LDNATNPDNTESQLGTDILRLYTHYFDPSPASLTNVLSYPANILSNYSSPANPFFGPAGLFGLGPDSTALNSLFNSHLISSRSYGLYLGTAYPRAGGDINGSLTLGGYDAGRFDGISSNWSMVDDVSNTLKLNVHVSQISLTFFNGSNTTVNLVDSSFHAEITTSQYPLTLPKSVTQNFANALSATPSNNDDNSLSTAEPFNGNLTITLSDGFTISFPPEWVSNASNISPISADPLTSSFDESNNDTFLLGTSFLSYLYLTVNYDSNTPQFNLFHALPDAPYVYVTTMCPNVVPTPYTTPSVSHFAGSGAAGAIVGGVIGGIAVTLTCLVLLRHCLRWKATRSKAVTAKQTEWTVMGKGWEMDKLEPATPGWPLDDGVGGRKQSPSSNLDPKSLRVVTNSGASQARQYIRKPLDEWASRNPWEKL
jgi:Eukaryotic aspartyl protease